VNKYPPIKNAIIDTIGIDKNTIAVSIAKLWVNIAYTSNAPEIPPFITKIVENKIIKIIHMIIYFLYLEIDLKKLPVIFALLPRIIVNDY